MKKILIGVIFTLAFACAKVSTPPVAVLIPYPPKGDSTVLFELNGSESYDNESLNPTLRFRWDFDGDGSWDTGFESQSVVLRHFPEPGRYDITIEVIDEDGLTSTTTDSIIVFGQNRDTSSFTDPRDGQTYRMVKIEEDWWMGENLRIGQPIDLWTQPQTDNQVIEYYKLWSTLNQKAYCAYTWYEAMNHKLNDRQGICPDGWHLPSGQEWETFYQEIPKFYAPTYYGENGLSGLNLQDGKRFFIDREDQMIDEDLESATYWNSENFNTYQGLLLVGLGLFTPTQIDLVMMEDIYLHFSDKTQIVAMVRCIKDR